MYVVVACAPCRRARVVEQGRKTAACSRCGRRLVLADLRVWHATSDATAAQHAVGLVNAKLARREEEFARALLPQAPPLRGHDDPWQAAAADARRAPGQAARLERLVRALALRLGTFGADDFARALAHANLQAGEAALDRFVGLGVLVEPRPGRYAAGPA